MATKGGNARNGKSAKTIKGEFGKMPIEIPRDRDATFEPLIIQKGQTRFDGFDGKSISLYARGMTTREIQGHLADIYGVDVSPSLISSVTDAVADEAKIWQNRPLDALYPIVYMDAVRVKVRDNWPTVVYSSAMTMVIVWSKTPPAASRSRRPIPKTNEMGIDKDACVVVSIQDIY